MVYHFLMACYNFRKSRTPFNKLHMEAQRQLALQGRTRGLDAVVKSAAEAYVAFREASDGPDRRQAEDSLIQQVLELSVYSSPAHCYCSAGTQLEPETAERCVMLLADSVVNLAPRYEQALFEELDNSALSLWANFVHDWTPKADSRRIRFLMEIV